MRKISLCIAILLASVSLLGQVAPFGTKIFNNVYIVKGTDTIWIQQDASYAQFYATKDFKFNDKVRITDSLFGVNSKFTGKVQGVAITDGTAILTSGALRSATDVIASDTVRGGTFFDGTLYITSGALRGATDIFASDTIQGGTLSVGASTLNNNRFSGLADLFASDTVQAGTFFDGTISISGGDLRGADTILVGYLRSSSTYFTGPVMFDDPGTSANSHLFSMRADNATNVQTATMQVIYGADPYWRLSAPDNTGAATPVMELKDQMINFFNGAAGVDYYFNFNGQSNQGTITYMEDEDRFTFDNEIASTKLLVTSTGSFGAPTRLYNGINIDGGLGISIEAGVPDSTSYALYNDAGTLTWNGSALATGASVSGTTGRVPRFTGASSLSDGVIRDDGTNIAVGGAAGSYNFRVYGDSYFSDSTTIAGKAFISDVRSIKLASGIAIQGTDYVGSTQKLIDLSPDNTIRFYQPVELSALYNVADVGDVSWLNLPIVYAANGTRISSKATVDGGLALRIQGTSNGTGGVVSGSVGVIDRRPIATITDTLTVTDDYYFILCDATSSGILVNLPAPTTNVGRVFEIKAINITNGVWIKSPSGNIDATAGATGIQISTNYVSVKLVSNGTNYYIF